MTTDQARHTPAYPPADLTNCDREPIHVPGAIQPHGALLAIGPDERIAVASTNTDDLLGRASSDLFGRPLIDVLPEAVQPVRESVDQETRLEAHRLTLGDHGRLGGRDVDLLVHRSGEFTVIEIEPVDARTAAVSHRAVRAAATRLAQASGVNDLVARLANEVRTLTGFDRVMVYRFDEQWNGEVVAEDRREDLNPFLGLHYPATDIPAQARRLYTENWTRLIADIAYEPVALNPVFDPTTGKPLDLSHSALRSVSPIHVEYLSNMGVTASMSVSMVHEDELWGLVACHHYSGPHPVSFDVRNAAEFLGQSASFLIGDRMRVDGQSAEIRAMQSLSELMARVTGSGGPVHDELIADPAMLELVDAGGAATWAEGRLLTSGSVPPDAVLHRIVALLHSEDGSARASSHLAALDPDLAEYTDTAAGALLVATGDSRWKLWLRPAQVHTVDWGGDPRNKAINASEGRDVRLSPRKSFERWREVVHDRSAPWEPWQIAVADELRGRISHELVRRGRDHLALAESLQRALVLAEAPEVEGFEVQARYRPAADIHLGGDWWDVFDLPDGRTAVVVGDVSGHGVQAATAMAQVRTSLRAYAFDGHAPGAVLDRLDQFVDASLPGHTATVVFAALDRATGAVEIANAGHPSPLHLGLDDDLIPMPAGRPLVGAGIGTTVTHRRVLEPGDLLVLFTDGLFERRHESVEDSLERLRAVATRIDRRSSAPDLAAWVDELLAHQSGAIDDDLTLLTIRRATP